MNQPDESPAQEAGEPAVSATHVQATYLTLLLGNTLAASFIWGINTLFLLDAGLTNFEAFAANAFFTAGMVLFEVPTGVVADTWGRRASYLLGTLTLATTTAMYYALWAMHGAFWLWAIVSVLLGLGFTFFSGAVEAWLVDALAASDYDGTLEAVFGRGQIVSGIAMLVGSFAGGAVAQISSLGVPFLMRVGVLVIMCVVAAILMKDIGFTPAGGAHPITATKTVLSASIEHGLGKPSVRWIMFAAPFTTGIGFYAFYAFQPFLLELYGNERAYIIAGLAASIISGAQIVGGLAAARVRQLFKRRTSPILLSVGIGAAGLIALGFIETFTAAIVLIAALSILGSLTFPIRQAYINGMIPSSQRATVLSFDSLIGNTGAVGAQPALGRVADLHGYGASLAVGGAVQLVALPCIMLSRWKNHSADIAESS